MEACGCRVPYRTLAYLIACRQVVVGGGELAVDPRAHSSHASSNPIIWNQYYCLCVLWFPLKARGNLTTFLESVIKLYWCNFHVFICQLLLWTVPGQQRWGLSWAWSSARGQTILPATRSANRGLKLHYFCWDFFFFLSAAAVLEIVCVCTGEFNQDWAGRDCGGQCCKRLKYFIKG